MSGIDELLADLPRSNPDAPRAQRVRARCHVKLSRSRMRVAKAGPIESALVGGFCAVYFSLLTLIALRSHGLL